MEDCVRIVQEHYNSDVQKEWERLERLPMSVYFYYYYY